MSIYRCYHCDNTIDEDYDGCNDHPTIDMECICDACLEYFPEPGYCISECYEK
jgi:hypothetical protein